MKREAFRHSKVFRLGRRLQVPHYAAVGILDCLWNLTEQEAPQGDIGKLLDEDIAIQIGWDADPEKLIAVLIECKLLDSDENHRVVVHDWSEHAQDAVHLRLARAGLRFSDGKVPKLNRLSKDERDKIASLYKSAQKRTASAQKRTASAPPNLTLPDRTVPYPTLPDQDKQTSGADAPPTPADHPKPKPWNAGAVDDYAEFQGEPEGDAKVSIAKRISKQLKPLVDKHTWAVVRQGWREHLRREGKFAGPEKFAERPGVWMDAAIKPRDAPTASLQPRPLRERDDVAVTPEQMALIRAGRVE